MPINKRHSNSIANSTLWFIENRWKSDGGKNGNWYILPNETKAFKDLLCVLVCDDMTTHEMESNLMYFVVIWHFLERGNRENYSIQLQIGTKYHQGN